MRLPEKRILKGIGSEIIRKCVAETDLPVFLYVFIRNSRAVSLYKRMGFRVTKTVRDSRHIMEKPFNA
jgi:ribosomal protein S18 acetylase RimI-like enzyme